jgi:hypothetical protein
MGVNSGVLEGGSMTLDQMSDIVFIITCVIGVLGGISFLKIAGRILEKLNELTYLTRIKD